MQNIKVVFVGDEKVGKTYLINKCAGAGMEDNNGNVTLTTTSFENRKISIGMWDTKGGSEYDRLRPLSYPCTEVFILCFSLVDSQDGFERISQRWTPELRYHMPNCAINLVGTKKDMRDDPQVLEGLQEKPISYEEGKRKAREIDAYSYIECSVVTGEGIAELIESSVRAVFYPPNHNRPKKKWCNIF